MMLTDLAQVLRSAGLAVVEVEGWKTRGHGPMASVDGVTCHHTASGRGTGTTLGLNTIVAGRPGLDGPLAHLYLNRAGTFYVVAAGLCYHAGVSTRATYTNPHRIGIEALAAGDGWSQDWPAEQMTAYARGCKALAVHYGFKVGEVRGHKETASPDGRKSDPTFDMPEFRRDVAAVDLTSNQEDNDMATINPDDEGQWPKHKLTDADAEALGGKSKAGAPVAWSTLWRFPPAIARLRREIAAGFKANAKASDVAAVAAAVAELDGKLGQLAEAFEGFIEGRQADPPA